jgi:4-hydroxy-4-methyl-2-oxoglutarate aldolase
MVETPAQRQFPLGNYCDADQRVKAMDYGIRPLADTMRVTGPAFTVSSPAGQNLAIHRAIAEARPGDVLVVAMDGDCRFGPFGEILALACQRREIAGLVLDGSVRDGSDIEALGFPVFCRGLAPSGTRKEAPGELGVSICCGGVGVEPGDIVVADRDGVVVIPAAAMDDVVSALCNIVDKEARIKEGIAAGKTTLEIMNLEKPTDLEEAGEQ